MTQNSSSASTNRAVDRPGCNHRARIGWVGRRPDRRFRALPGSGLGRVAGRGRAGAAGRLVVEEPGDQATQDHGHGEAVGLAPLLQALVLLGGEADGHALPGAAGLGPERGRAHLGTQLDPPVLLAELANQRGALEQFRRERASARLGPRHQPGLHQRLKDDVLLLGRERADGLQPQPRQL
jgi:hypothetical protein